MDTKELKIPLDRVAVLIGKDGEVKKEIEVRMRVRLEVDSKEGDVIIEGEDSTNKIREEWAKMFGNGRKKMLDIIEKYRGLIIKFIGAISIITGIVCWLYATYLIKTTNQTIDAAGYYSIGIGFFSIGIAILSHIIAKESDEKMKLILIFHMNP